MKQPHRLEDLDPRLHKYIFGGMDSMTPLIPAAAHVAATSSGSKKPLYFLGALVLAVCCIACGAIGWSLGASCGVQSAPHCKRGKC